MSELTVLGEPELLDTLADLSEENDDLQAECEQIKESLRIAVNSLTRTKDELDATRAALRTEQEIRAQNEKVLLDQLHMVTAQRDALARQVSEPPAPAPDPYRTESIAAAKKKLNGGAWAVFAIAMLVTYAALRAFN